MSERGEEDLGDRVDEISQLPDCILHHILSFIPTRDVVKTSILSKRWNNLWTFVSNLDFDDALLYTSEMDGRDPPEVSCFMNFVERVLLLRDPSDLKKFRLSCRVCFNAPRIHSWISVAIMHNVKDLDLCLFAQDPSVLPFSMFCSISLAILKIEMTWTLKLPNSICLPSLKSLHLSLVTFPDDDSTQKLFLGCPVLEELVMLDCDWTNLNNITIFSSTLQRLMIDDLPYFGPPDSSSGCKITINASNLMYLCYTGYLSNKIFMNNACSLVKAYISVAIPDERRNQVACHVVDLLKGLWNVASLTISNRTIESLAFAGYMLVNFPVFQNLITVEYSMIMGKPTVGALIKLFNRFPNLESLHFTEGFEDEPRLENVYNWVLLSKFVPSRLRKLIFKNFHGYNSEIYFLNTLVQHKLALEKMDICCHENLLADLKKKDEVRKEIKGIAKGSTSCVITFS